jgi:hypothetical protein
MPWREFLGHAAVVHRRTGAAGLIYGPSPMVFTASVLTFTGAAIPTILIPKPAKDVCRAAVMGHPSGRRATSEPADRARCYPLDLFAVLLGGATALMPARATLRSGRGDLLLRSAAGIGALIMGIWLVRNPISNRAGLTMFCGVAVYGVSIIVFGLSTTLWISIPALVIMGAADMVSVNVRGTLVQLATPDDVRGRVSAVNSVFIGASNELGEFAPATWRPLSARCRPVVGGARTLLTPACDAAVPAAAQCSPHDRLLLAPHSRNARRELRPANGDQLALATLGAAVTLQNEILEGRQVAGHALRM